MNSPASGRRYAKSALVLALLAALVTGCTRKPLLTAEDIARAGEWPLPRHDVGNSGATEGTLSRRLDIAWRTDIRSLDPTAPTIYGELVFVGTPSKYVVALDAATGKPAARLWVDTPMQLPPTLRDSLMIFAGFGNWNRVGVYNLLRDKLIWRRFAGDVATTPAPVGSLLALATLSGRLFLLSAATGQTTLKLDLGGPALAQPAVCGDTLWVAAGNLVCAVTTGGDVIWRRRVEHAVTAVALAGKAVIAASDNAISALKRDDGSTLWRKELGLRLLAPAAREELIVAATTSGNVLCVNALGEPLWRTNLSSVVAAPPILVGDDAVVATYAGRIFLISIEDGTVRGELDIGKKVRQPPASDGKSIFLSTQDGFVFRLR